MKYPVIWIISALAFVGAFGVGIAISQNAKSHEPVGYVGVIIGYVKGQPAGAKVLGYTSTVQACREKFGMLAAEVIEGGDELSQVTVACVPVPPAADVTQAPHREPKPTASQKQTDRATL